MQIFRNMDQPEDQNIQNHPAYSGLSSEKRSAVDETYRNTFLSNQGRVGIKIAQGIAYATAKQMCESFMVEAKQWTNPTVDTVKAHKYGSPVSMNAAGEGNGTVRSYLHKPSGHEVKVKKDGSWMSHHYQGGTSRTVSGKNHEDLDKYLKSRPTNRLGESELDEGQSEDFQSTNDNLVGMTENDNINPEDDGAKGIQKKNWDKFCPECGKDHELDKPCPNIPDDHDKDSKDSDGSGDILKKNHAEKGFPDGKKVNESDSLISAAAGYITQRADAGYAKLTEGAEEHEKLKDHTKNPFHSTLMSHGFEHKSTEHQKNRFAPNNPKADSTVHVYTHPKHGKSHVIVSQEHDPSVGHGGRTSKGYSYIHRHEQSNGIMAPSHGDSKVQLHRDLSQDYGVPKGMEAPKLTASEKKYPHTAPKYKMNESSKMTEPSPALSDDAEFASGKWMDQIFGKKKKKVTEEESISEASKKKAPKPYDVGADVRAIARERVGQVPGKKVMMPKTKKAPKYKQNFDEQISEDYESGKYKVAKTHGGTVLTHKKTGKDVFMQGDDATTLHRELNRFKTNKVKPEMVDHHLSNYFTEAVKNKYPYHEEGHKMLVKHGYTKSGKQLKSKKSDGEFTGYNYTHKTNPTIEYSKGKSGLPYWSVEPHDGKDAGVGTHGLKKYLETN
jgi:hypothetical protein